MRLLLFALLTLLPQSRADAEAVRVTVRPERVYFGWASSNQSLNFDFLLENLTADALRITAMSVRTFRLLPSILQRPK